ncbi:MAG: response regulator, partial [Cyanobacteria bacterium J06649_11]
MNRILIAEDNPHIAEFIEAGLQAHRYTTLVVKNGREVADIASSKDFELLILDLGLPGMDGMEVLRQLRGRGETLPIIIWVRLFWRDETTLLPMPRTRYESKII